MKTQNTAQKLIFSLLLIIGFSFSSCVQNDQEFSSNEIQIQRILEKYNFQLDHIDRENNRGIKTSNLNEFEELIKFLKGIESDPNSINEILKANDIRALPFLNKNYFKLSDLQKFPQDRITCIDSWRTVYARIGIRNSSTHIDLSFQTGTGSGLISNFDAVLGGLTFMTSLGKNNFLNTEAALSSNNYGYSGIYTYSIKYVLFIEGIGDIWTSETFQVRIRVDGCSGLVTYSNIEP
jgi:hypothetical protein